MILKSRIFIDLRKLSILRKPGSTSRLASSKVERRPYYKISVKQSVPFIYQKNEQRFTKNNTISLERAVDELGIEISDLRDLDPELLRSPYQDGKFIKVYKEEDVINIARKKAKKTGRYEIIEKILGEKDDVEKYKTRLNKRMQSRHNTGDETGVYATKGSEETVVFSLLGNAGLCFFKSMAAISTGSASMVSEAVHSFTDTMNQLVLYYGISAAKRPPSVEHPYGHQNMKYVTSLVSGVGIFCLGAGVSIWHGLSCLYAPNPFDQHEIFWAYTVLGAGFFVETLTLGKALLTAAETAASKKITLLEHIKSGSDPHTNVVLLEDLVAVGGCAVAGGCMYMTVLTGNPVWDASGSIVIGLGLANVAWFLIRSNTKYLVGQSISQDIVMDIQDSLEDRNTVKAIMDVKATYLGPDRVRLKAEVQFDGRQVAKNYLSIYSNTEIDDQFRYINSLPDHERIPAARELIVEHIDGAIDDLGEEIDKIETELKAKYPEIKHVDLEQN